MTKERKRLLRGPGQVSPVLARVIGRRSDASKELIPVAPARVQLPQKKHEEVEYKPAEACRPQTKGALEQEVEEEAQEKADPEKPEGLEEDQKPSGDKVAEKG